MMKLANNLVLRVFVRDDEDEIKIRSSLISLIPFDLEKEKLKLKEEVAQGIEYKKIKILSLTLEKSKHVNEFLRGLVSKLSQDQKERLLKQYDSRIDEGVNFYIRFDKDYLLENRCEFTDTGNCFHLKINLACFPAKKENGKFVLERILALS